MKPQKRTKAVLGYKLTLEAGRRYLATRPMAGTGLRKAHREWFPVTIKAADDPLGNAIAYVDDMPYTKANKFLNAFNNRKTSFEGRIW